MKKIPLKNAISNYSHNKPFSLWSSGEPDAPNPWEKFEADQAADRVFSDFLHLKFKPKFKFPSTATFFASGSCFAREIELALNKSNYKVLSWSPSLEKLGLTNDLFHRYTTHAIINDFEYALNDTFNQENIHQFGTKWIDYTGHGSYTSKDEAINKRLQVIEIHKSIKYTDVLFVTLGLVETWYDKDTDSYLNIPPWGNFKGDRFELRITDYNENLNSLRKFIQFVRSHRSNLKIILTVSPVPLASTFSDTDVIIANSYSKSTLRSVVDAICEEDDLVDYFPSYELVTMSSYSEAWYPDYRHVKREFVEKIIKFFISSYIE